MFDATAVSPLNSILTNGRFGNIFENQRPSFSLRPMPYLSICRVVAFTETIDSLKTSLKGMLGLMMPSPQKVFTAGTRIALRPNHCLSCYIVTEGEAEHVLYNRLYSPLFGECAVFDVTHGMTVLRFEGLQTEEILRSGCQTKITLENYPEGHVQELTFDGIKILVHRSEQDRWFLYIPRSYAQIIYTWLVRSCLPSGIQLYTN
jgi:heterotetrameric sarcosine oxidase gamma subunit